MKVALAGWNSGDSTAFQPVVKDLATNECGMQIGGGIVLQLEEEAGLGCCGRGDRFGGGQCIEDKGGERELLREWC